MITTASASSATAPTYVQTHQAMPDFLADTGAVGMTPAEMQGVQGEVIPYFAVFVGGVYIGTIIGNYIFD